ncbi:MAG: V-type ATP synthase subunit E [Methanospirillaceae archaeon]|nr:V-type ATP synthase subunit E [Methanospirillaceae archaeon]
MNTETFIGDIQTTACEEVSEILRKAEKEAACIISDAEQTGKMKGEKHRELAEKKIESEKVKALFSIRSEVKAGLTREKYNAFESCFDSATRELQSIRSHDNYQDFFTTMLKEALLELDEPDPVIHIDPKDDAVCKTSLRELKASYTIVADSDSAGGVRVRSADGKIIVRNTIESRLERGREMLKEDIFRELFG